MCACVSAYIGVCALHVYMDVCTGVYMCMGISACMSVFVLCMYACMHVCVCKLKGILGRGDGIWRGTIRMGMNSCELVIFGGVPC